jgi:hypothetical protein
MEKAVKLADSQSGVVKLAAYAIESNSNGLVAVVIVLVPVTVSVPAVLVFIPPLVTLPPAALSGFMQFAALVISLPAVASVAVDGFVQSMLGMHDPMLAPVGAFCMKARHHGEAKNHR